MSLSWMTPLTRRVVRGVLAVGYLFIGQALGDRYPLYTGTISDDVWRYGFTIAAVLLVVQSVAPRWMWSAWLYELGAGIALVLGMMRASVLVFVVVPRVGPGAMVELGLWANLLVMQGASFVSNYREIRGHDG